MKTHDLKVWPDFFASLSANEKTFEVRKDDRGYETGDRLVLREWNSENESYTGRETWRQVGYIMRGGQFGIEPGYVVMAVN